MSLIKERIKKMENDPLCSYMEALGETDDMICTGCGYEFQTKYGRQWVIKQDTFDTIGPLCGKCTKKEMGGG